MLKIKKALLVFITNLLILIFLLISAELILGTWFNKNNFGNLIIPRNIVSIIDNAPYDRKNSYVYSRDENGFRANNYPLSEIDILVIGGSTTEERDVGDEYIWTKVFEKEISKYKNFKVLNAGIGGQTSYGHSKIFDLWINKFDELKPEYIFIFIGINDAINLFEISTNGRNIENRFFYEDDKDNLTKINKIDSLIVYLKNNSYFHSAYLNIRSKILLNKFNFNYSNEHSFNFYKIVSEELSTQSKKIDLEIKNKIILQFSKLYNNNLKKIFQATSNKNSKTIFITQTVYEDDILYDYLELINNLTISFCEVKNLTCLKLNKKHNIKKHDYYDSFHTNPYGSKKIGKLIADMFLFELNNSID